MRGLPRTVKGAKPDTSGNAVDDGLRNFYACLFVLRGDGEREVDDVGLNFFDSHNVGPFVTVCARVGARVKHRIENHSRLDYVYIIPIFFKKTRLFNFLNDSAYLAESFFSTRLLFCDRENPTTF